MITERILSQLYCPEPANHKAHAKKEVDDDEEKTFVIMNLKKLHAIRSYLFKTKIPVRLEFPSKIMTVPDRNASLLGWVDFSNVDVG